jgi:hypothetical protein
MLPIAALGRPPLRRRHAPSMPSRRLRPDLVDGETALEQAKTFARAARERLGRFER